MTPEEKWIEQHTFYCSDRRARITPEQCDQNRKKSDGRNWGVQGGGKDLHPACELCTDFEELKATVKKRLPQSQEGKKMPVGECRGCHAPRVNLQARRLCGKCLKQFYKKRLVEEDGLFVWKCDPLPKHVLEEQAKAAERKEPATAMEFLRQEAEKEKAKPKKQEQAAIPKPKEKPVKPASKSLEVVDRDDSWPSFVKDSAPETVTIGGIALKRWGKTARKDVGEPLITVRLRQGKKGNILSVNKSAVEQYFKDFRFVDIYPDPESKVVAFYPLMEATDSKTFNLQKKSPSENLISATDLARELGLEAGKYRIKPADIAGFYIVDFKEKAA